MFRIKTLSWPIVFALAAVVAGSGLVNAEVIFELSTHKTFRQKKNGKTSFQSGRYDAFFRDGNAIYVAGCDWPYYRPANPGLFCSGGSTGFVSFGDLDLGSLSYGPYFWITDVIPAVIVEPRRPDLCQLRAAPASTMKRPAIGFVDESYGVYYNLHDSSSVVESIVSRYSFTKEYSAGQNKKFNEEVVPGVYHYTFPRLKNEIVKVPISPVVYPMPDAYDIVNNQKSGVKFVNTNRWTKKGFMELSYIKPNIIKWTGFTPSNVYAGVDALHFSLRYLSNTKDPNSAVVTVDPVTGDSPASLFPAYVNGGDPRVTLRTPYVNSFTLPPTLKSGSRAVVELELDRTFQTGGATYDYSTRKFQLPVEVVNRYTDYADVRFDGSTNDTDILDDPDKDGFNNMTEWILGSRAEDKFSVPVDPVPVNHNDNYFYYWFYYYYNYYKPQWFGFLVDKVQRNVPAVRYTLQRSTDKGITWSTFESDSNWLVTSTAEGILVESRIISDNGTANIFGDDLYIQPPGTEGDKYRIKITLAK